MKKDTKQTFIQKAKQIHGDKYDYSKVDYINSKTKICIICPKHGEFWQTPIRHLSGSTGCKACSSKKQAESRTYTTSSFKEKVKNVHDEVYDDSQLIYINAETKITLICSKHGEFEIMPTRYLKGHGCQKCAYSKMGRDNTRNTAWFIKKAIEVHGYKYDYSKVNYINAKTKVCIICPEHGEFWQTPSGHLNTEGCSRCSFSKLAEQNTKTEKEFIDHANKVHNNKYKYKNYTKATDKVTIICPEHGDFEQLAYTHLQGAGCPYCRESYGERQLRDYFNVSNIAFEAQKRFKTCKNKKELPFDFFLKDYNLCIEYQGIQHRQTVEGNFFGGQDALEARQKRDQIKRDWCKENDVNLLEYWFDDSWPFSSRFFEWECTRSIPEVNFLSVFESGKFEKDRLNITEEIWRDKKEIVLSRLNKENANRIFARKCKVIEIKTPQARTFLEENHLQGYANSRIKLGLEFEGELMSIMTFGSQRKALGRKPQDGHFELIRFASKLNHIIVGGASKLLKAFIRLESPKNIISYADKNWSTVDNVYEKLGFQHIHDSNPSYKYFLDGIGFDRFQFRKGELVKNGHDPNKSESEIMQELGYSKIFDLGTKLYSMPL